MLPKIPQAVPPSRFFDDECLRARGDRASATTRDLVEMTELVIAHVARNRELDQRMRLAAGVKRPWVVRVPSSR
jgi:hypothetical protein